MPDIYVRSTDGNNADSGATWALAKATLAGADAIDAAGDKIWLSQAHSETTAAGVTFSLAGTLTSPTRVVAGNDAAAPPTALATAIIATTGASSIVVNGCAYVYGVIWNVGSTAVTASLTLNNAANNKQVYESNDFVLVASGTSCSIILGTQSSLNANAIDLNNCRFKFSAAGQGVSPCCKLRINGGSIISGGTSPTNFFASYSNSRPLDVVVTGFDFSNAAAGLNLAVGGGIGSGGTLVFRYCKLPASWSGALVSTAITNPGVRVEMHSCDSGNTTYRFWSEDYGGSIKHETTLVRTGGPTDGTTPLSWKMVSAAAVAYPTTFLQSPEFARRYVNAGVAVTATVEILRDSATNLKDNEVWLRLFYYSSSTTPLATMIEDVVASVVATAADQDASTATWTTTGMTNPNTQKLVCTFTPQQAGYVVASVILAKPSTTIYVAQRAEFS